jgi:predicted DCC family thiol-disulfide oxidoreductase YuxK
MVTTQATPEVPSGGWVFFDGDCPFCRRWLGMLRNILARRGFVAVPLQEPWVGGRLGLHGERLLYDLQLLTADERLISGADVYLYITRRIWWAWLFSVLFGLPGFNRLIHLGYRWFANHRYCISGACRRSAR